MARENSPETVPTDKTKMLNLCQLNKKKSDLMAQLKNVDKELLEQKFQPGQPLKELKELRLPKNRK
jgi:hypothetical protein